MDGPLEPLTYWRYAAYGSRDVHEVAGRLKQLTAYFHSWRLAGIDASAILGYINYRKAQGRANETINADPALLRQTLRVVQELGKVATVPRVRVLKPAPPRAGFFDAEQFELVANALPPDLGLVVRIGYTLGRRLSSPQALGQGVPSGWLSGDATA